MIMMIIMTSDVDARCMLAATSFSATPLYATETFKQDMAMIFGYLDELHEYQCWNTN